MSYEEEIKKRLANRSEWPSYSNPDILSRLDEMADNALTVDKVDETTCIASILILQQIIEELILVQVRMCQFLIQVRLLPIQLNFKESNARMFGRLIEDLKATIEFPHKDQMIDLANRVNRERIEIAHGLVKSPEGKDFIETALNVRKLFEEFFNVHSKSYDWLCLRLKSLKHEVLSD